MSDDALYEEAVNTDPTGYIECNGDLMPFWLPDGVDPDELEIEWVAP